MADRFSLKDHLFNADSLADLAAEFAAGVDGFDADEFLALVLPGLQGRELLQRLEWICDCLEPQLARDFPTMATQLEAAMPPPLDPGRTDDDFGRFIHAVPGILAVRHGLETHAPRALDVLHAATQRFSMEFYIRPFLNRWPDLTLARLADWAGDENYHVRRLVSEGTRARLPWAKNIDLDPLVPLQFLDRLYADKTRYVTRSVANHLNDIAKIDADLVVARLRAWRDEGRQTPKEMAWITRHALRTLIKQGHAGALELLGYRADVVVDVALHLSPDPVQIDASLELDLVLTAEADTPVLVDYVIWFQKANGTQAPKVFKLKTAHLKAGKPLNMRKAHRLKGDATTFRLFPGAHRVQVQINGVVRAEQRFDLQPSDN